MQTSLARRQQRRLNGGRRRGGGAGRAALIGFPLFLFGTLAALALVGFLGVVGAYAYYSQDLADPHKLEQLVYNQESVIMDRTNTVELARFGTERRQVVQYSDLSPAVLDATTAVEDHTFWTNTGFDPVGIAAAALDTLRGDSRGGSTITQQLVRQRLLDPALVQDPTRKVERKIKEIIQSIRLTEAYPGTEGKQRIITAYLNQNFYGNNNYGIKAAAQNYFGVTDLNKLTLAQAAILVGIPQSPSEFDLVKNAVQQDNGKLAVPQDSPVVQRRNLVLDAMQRFGTPMSDAKGISYTPADYAAAMSEPVVLAPQTLPNWKAPHFVWAVREELVAKLCDPGAETCPELEAGGMRIITTLDWRLQQLAEKWVRAGALVPNAPDPVADAKALGLSYAPWMRNLRNGGIGNGAMAATDYQTGEVLAYVGSADYYSKTATKKFQPQFDVLGDGWRQVGSSFKPFNYVTGINDRVMTAASLLMDVTTNFGDNYIPTDADGLERGPLRMRQALQFSLNIPAVKALAYNGIDHIYEMSRQFGLRYQTQQRTAGLSLTLGTELVHPMDLVTAYGTLANSGAYIGSAKILRIMDSSGRDMVTPYKPPPSRQVVSPQAAYIMSDVLKGNTDPSQNAIWGVFKILDGQGHRRPATLKTGTNNDAKDLIAAGYLAPPDAAGRKKDEHALAVVAWMGNSDNSQPRSDIFSVDATTFVWQGFLDQATANWAIRDFARPAGVTTAAVDAYSGMKPGPFTSRTIQELFIAGTEPAQIDTTKVGVKIEQETNKLWQDGCPGTAVTKGFLNLNDVESAFPAWNAADRAWLARAARGPGVRGGPRGTRTTYFVNFFLHPYGLTWGAAFPPTTSCTIGPSPTPVPTECLPGPLGTPCPSVPPTPTPTPKVAHRIRPEGSRGLA